MNIFKPAAAKWLLLLILLGLPAQSGYAEGMMVELGGADADTKLDADKPSRNQSGKERIGMKLIVKASPEAAMVSTLDIDSPQLQKQIRKAHSLTLSPEVVSDMNMELTENGVTRTYTVDGAFRLVSSDGANSLELPDSARRSLERYANSLRASHYGEMENWSDAQKDAPLKSVVTVIDLETGLRFQAQRRAGKQHADVQPLTKQDTAVMKQIYGGEWSWKRRAIVVLVNGKQLAGSMHGMPHGGDGIPGNGFSGHFCIHFLGSTTHGSGNSDPDHQLMVHKAAGRLTEYFATAAPEQVVQSFFVALNVRDALVLRMAFADARNAQLQFFAGKLPGILAVDADMEKAKIAAISGTDSDITVKATLSQRGSGMERYVFQFKLNRPSENDPWKIVSMTQTADGKRKKKSNK